MPVLIAGPPSAVATTTPAPYEPPSNRPSVRAATDKRPGGVAPLAELGPDLQVAHLRRVERDRHHLEAVGWPAKAKVSGVLVAAIQNGGCGFCVGRGSDVMFSKLFELALGRHPFVVEQHT